MSSYFSKKLHDIYNPVNISSQIISLLAKQKRQLFTWDRHKLFTTFCALRKQYVSTSYYVSISLTTFHGPFVGSKAQQIVLFLKSLRKAVNLATSKL